MEEEFEPGEIVEHKLSKEWVMVISYKDKDKTYSCRTKSFEVRDFYSFELQKRR